MSENKNDGGSAFPSHGTMGEVVCEGMTLRDWFAGQALIGLARSEHFESNLKLDVLAKFCYEYADSMIAEREK